MKPTRILACLVVGACLHATLRAAEPAAAPTPPAVPTIIESAGPAEMVSTATESTFTFRDRVVVTGANLRLTCDLLVVVARRTGDPKATLGKQDNFKSLIATGNVRLVQGGREAICGRAEVLPGEDKVILTENPKVRLLDGSYEASGPRMVLLRGEQRAVIEGGTRFVLPPIRDLGPKKDADKKTSPAAEPPPKVGLPK
jgi:lipopolysaccharide export system protein LptA